MKKSLKIIFGVLAVLLIVVALWRVAEYDSATSVQHGKKKTAAPLAAESSAVQAPSKYDEFLEGAAAPVSRTQNTQPIPTKEGKTLPPQGPVFITEKQPYPNQAAPRQPYPTHRTIRSENGRVVNTNFYAQDRGENTTQVTKQAYMPRSKGTKTPDVGWNASQTAMQEERAGRVLAPFMRTNRKDQDRMNAQWAKLSAAIDRAVLQALTPKSKKEAMIEKYAPAQQGAAADPVMQSSGLTGAFAPVGQAISTQKQEIMQNFGSAFGGKASQQAGSLMDSFAGELGSTLNTPGLTQEQAAKRVQEISKKYQKKMNELAEQKQAEKFMADRQAQDNQQKEALHNLYPDGQVSEQINQYIDTASQKVQELVRRTDLSQEEQTAQFAQIEQEKRDGIQNAIVQSGQSLNPFYSWEQKQSEEDLAKLKAKIESGEVESIARPATPKETSTMKENVKAQRQGLEKGLLEDPRFGQQAVEEVAPILNNYENQLNELYRAELSPDDRREKEVELLKSVNRSLLQKRMEQVERMDIPATQKQQAIAEIQKAYDNIK